MPDNILPKPTPPAPLVPPTPGPVVTDDSVVQPLKLSAQGEIVTDVKPADDDLTPPPSTLQSAPPAPLPPLSPPTTTMAPLPSPTPPATPTPLTPPTPPGSSTVKVTSTVTTSATPTPLTTPASAPATITTNPTNPPPATPASTPSTSPTSPATPPPATLTALSSMTSASVPPTPPPSPTTSAPTTAKTQPVLATAPKKSLPLTLLIGIGALVLLILGAIAFFLLRPSPSPVFTGSGTSDTTGGNPATGGQTQGSGSNAGGATGSASQPADGTGASSGSSTTGAGQPVVLEYWGLWEPEDLMAGILVQYQSAHPGVSVRYTKQSYQDYRERLQTAVASGNGPDLFRFHASWVPMLKNELAPMPASIMTSADFSNIFFPIATTQLQQNGQIVGIPLMYDGLVLYYNKDIFKTAGVDPPQTWADVRTLASKLAIKNSSGGLQRGGIAMGNVSNVEHFSDILGTLLLQNGADLTRPNSAQTRDALLFYTNFVKVDKVWDDQLPSSTLAFSRGDVAMMFAPSWRAHDIAAQNPSLQFGTVPLPKLSENRLGWATYWAEGVSQQSKHKQEAWELLKYLSSSPILQQQYSQQASARSFGEIYPRKDIAGELANTEVVKSVLEDAPFAKNWYLNSYTHDNGINDKLIQYYTDAVNGILTGKRPEDVLVTLEQGTAQVLGQYNVGLTL